MSNEHTPIRQLELISEKLKPVLKREDTAQFGNPKTFHVSVEKMDSGEYRVVIWRGYTREQMDILNKLLNE